MEVLLSAFSKQVLDLKKILRGLFFAWSKALITLEFCVHTADGFLYSVFLCFPFGSSKRLATRGLATLKGSCRDRLPPRFFLFKSFLFVCFLGVAFLVICYYFGLTQKRGLFS